MPKVTVGTFVLNRNEIHNGTNSSIPAKTLGKIKTIDYNDFNNAIKIVITTSYGDYFLTIDYQDHKTYKNVLPHLWYYIDPVEGNPETLELLYG